MCGLHATPNVYEQLTRVTIYHKNYSKLFESQKELFRIISEFGRQDTKFSYSLEISSTYLLSVCTFIFFPCLQDMQENTFCIILCISKQQSSTIIRNDPYSRIHNNLLISVVCACNFLLTVFQKHQSRKWRLVVTNFTLSRLIN